MIRRLVSCRFSHLARGDKRSFPGASRFEKPAPVLADWKRVFSWSGKYVEFNQL